MTGQPRYRCQSEPQPSRYGAVTEVWLPEPAGPVVDCASGSGPCAQPFDDYLGLVDQSQAGSGPPALLRPPRDTQELARYRWLVGHQSTFVVWRLLTDAMASALDHPDQAASACHEAGELFGVYSVLLLYSGSCPPGVYHDSLRPEMMSCHPAFSGEWAPDHRPVLSLLHRVRRECPTGAARELMSAFKANQRVHMAVARALVPDGESLLRKADRRPGQRPSAEEHRMYDRFFRVRRRPVCHRTLRAQLVRRVGQACVDLATHGLYYGGPAVSASAEDSAQLVRRVEEQAGTDLAELAERVVRHADRQPVAASRRG
ncbi:hypothetical protein [Goodfellowiella coeruleoviolacea]|uniref:Uncharacterized protein n=1 Tax=Goodfellowiella coeruleoviolacea TaxID=334858 RepID=A0AAE3GFT5_9PSEU|nr:hypothetical protein [Goodfellowiella coeruleoviolacea]MCP2166569.1 hypothetical protein [Goodfellowiella coeruleoviolacea]